jgi:hypothetical protein
VWLKTITNGARSISLMCRVWAWGGVNNSTLLCLQATPDHLVLVGLVAPTYKRSGEVAPGDIMWVATSASSSSLVAASVAGVRRVVKEGVYAPLTLGGSILVNGVTASVHRQVNTNSDRVGAL